jgi:hypothetical protein
VDERGDALIRLEACYVRCGADDSACEVNANGQADRLDHVGMRLVRRVQCDRGNLDEELAWPGLWRGNDLDDR